MPNRSPEPELHATWHQVLTLRLARQHLADRTGPEGLLAVADRLVGLHAQVMSSAELQAGVRVEGLRRSDVGDALWTDRSLVKTWAFRQTLHLLTPDDLVEFVLAARSLERWHTPAWLRYFRMTEAGVEEVIDAIGDVLSGTPMTRVPIVDAVVKKVERPHLRDEMLTGWGTFLGPAAQRGRLIFGPSEGRNVAFVDPSDWLGRSVEPDLAHPAVADEALARLVERYLTAFPGASREMIARWWGGGRVAAVTRALAVLGRKVAEIDVDGSRGLVLRRDLADLRATELGEHVRLLPGFDPFTNELPRHVESVLGDADHDRVHRTAGWVSPVVLVDGRVAGTWEIENGRAGAAVVRIRPFGGLRRGVRTAIKPEVDRLASFLDRRLTIEVEPAGQVSADSRRPRPSPGTPGTSGIA